MDDSLDSDQQVVNKRLCLSGVMACDRALEAVASSLGELPSCFISGDSLQVTLGHSPHPGQDPCAGSGLSAAAGVWRV